MIMFIAVHTFYVRWPNWSFERMTVIKKFFLNWKNVELRDRREYILNGGGLGNSTTSLSTDIEENYKGIILVMTLVSSSSLFYLNCPWFLGLTTIVTFSTIQSLLRVKNPCPVSTSDGKTFSSLNSCFSKLKEVTQVECQFTRVVDNWLSSTRNPDSRSSNKTII